MKPGSAALTQVMAVATAVALDESPELRSLLRRAGLGERPAAPAEEQRREPRQSVEGQAWVSRPTPDLRRPDDPFERRPIAKLNRSRRGIAFLSSTPMTPGTFHKLELTIDGRSIVCEVRVRHCRGAGDRFVVGGELC